MYILALVAYQQVENQREFLQTNLDQYPAQQELERGKVVGEVEEGSMELI